MCDVALLLGPHVLASLYYFISRLAADEFNWIVIDELVARVGNFDELIPGIDIIPINPYEFQRIYAVGSYQFLRSSVQFTILLQYSR